MASHLEAGDAQAVGRLALQAVEAMTSNLPTIKVSCSCISDQAAADKKTSLYNLACVMVNICGAVFGVMLPRTRFLQMRRQFSTF